MSNEALFITKDPLFTAVTFAEHVEMSDLVCLSKLGKIAKELAGPAYNTIWHLEFGQVGFLPLSFWRTALLEYFRREGDAITPREYAHLVADDVRRADIASLDRIAEQLDPDSTPYWTYFTEETPSRLFPVSVLDEATEVHEFGELMTGLFSRCVDE